MNEVERLEKRVDNILRAEKIIKRLKNTKFFLPNIASRSKNRRSFSRKQLRQWLREDICMNENIIGELLATNAIVEIAPNTYAVSKDFRDFFPKLNSGISPTEIIETAEF